MYEISQNPQVEAALVEEIDRWSRMCAFVQRLKAVFCFKQSATQAVAYSC